MKIDKKVMIKKEPLQDNFYRKILAKLDNS